MFATTLLLLTAREYVFGFDFHDMIINLMGLDCRCSLGEVILFLPHLVLFYCFNHGGIVLVSNGILIRSGYSELALTLPYLLEQVAEVLGNGHARLGGGSAQVTLDWVLIRRRLR
jgi:hypothetical protein